MNGIQGLLFISHSCRLLSPCPREFWRIRPMWDTNQPCWIRWGGLAPLPRGPCVWRRGRHDPFPSRSLSRAAETIWFFASGSLARSVKTAARWGPTERCFGFSIPSAWSC